MTLSNTKHLFICNLQKRSKTKPENLDEGDETYSQAETKEAAYVADQTDSEHLLFVNLKWLILKYLQRELHLLNYLCAVGFFDKDLEQSNIRFHIFENLLFKGIHPGPIPPLQGIRDKEYVARITGEHIVHIATEVGIALFQSFCL